MILAPWVWITLGAATAQTARFTLQKKLRGGTLSTAGSTFARFVWSAPLVAVLALGYAAATGQAATGFGADFWGYAVVGGVAQILATTCTVALFTQRHFAVGITFKKTEVVQAAIFGLLVLGEGVSAWSLAAILIGLAGVVQLSQSASGTGPWTARLFNRAAGLGLASGALFGISGVAYRGASLSLDSGDAFLRATATLACVTAFQTVAMALWLGWRERGEMGRVIASWRVSGLVGLTSMIGSVCWFVAFTLQTVALVKAVGQVELVLSLIVGWRVFGERITAREWRGLSLLAVSIVMLILLPH